MKIRVLLTLAGLAIGFTLPTFAQQQNTPDPKLRDELVAFNKKFDDAMLKEDAAALAAFYTEDACYCGSSCRTHLWPEGHREILHRPVQESASHQARQPRLAEQYSALHIVGTAGNEIWTGSVNKILTSLPGGENSQDGLATAD